MKKLSELEKKKVGRGKRGRRGQAEEQSPDSAEIEMNESAATDRDQRADLKRINPSADPNFDPDVGADADSRMVILRNAVPKTDVKRRNQVADEPTQAAGSQNDSRQPIILNEHSISKNDFRNSDL